MPSQPELLDLHSRPITELDIQRSLRVNIVAGFFGTLWMAMTINYSLTLFMEAIGASGVMIGLMMTARQIMVTVQIPSALIFENLPEHRGSRKRRWSIPALAHRLPWLIIAGLALCWKPGASWLPWAVIVIVGLSDLLANASAPMWYSWMADLIPHKTAGAFWGRRQSIATIGALLGMALAGFLLDRFRVPATGKTSALGFALVFSIGAVWGASDILIHLKVKEPRRTPIAPGTAIAKRLLAPLLNRDFLRLTLAMGAVAASMSMLGPFGLIYLKRNYPVTYTHIAALSIIGSLGAACASFSMGKLMDRIGPRVLCAILLVVAPLTSASWFFINTSYVTLHLPWIGDWSVPQAVLNQAFASFLGGALYSAIFPCQLRLTALLSNTSGRTMAMAVHWSVIGIVGSFGSILGGTIMDWFSAHPQHYLFPSGTSFSFYHVILGVLALLLWGVSLPLILSIRTPVDRAPFGKTVARIINPFNVIRSLASLRWPVDEEEEEDEPTRK